MRNASMKVLKNLVCCAAFICLMFVLAMPAHAASKADELLQLVNAERAQAGVAPLSMGSSALNAAAQARAKELTVNYSYNRPNGSREFTILPEYGVDDVSVGENYWAAAENASDVVAAWNRYDFFKERMLDKDATSVGIGYYEGGEYGNYWVMIFTYARDHHTNHRHEPFPVLLQKQHRGLGCLCRRRFRTRVLRAVLLLIPDHHVPPIRFRPAWGGLSDSFHMYRCSVSHFSRIHKRPNFV